MDKPKEIDPCSFIFVVGTPGAGKSLFCNELKLILRGNGIKSSKHGDYPCLLQLFEDDQKAGRTDRFKSGGETLADFEVVDRLVYDEALRLVCKKVLARSPGPKSVKIVEFARPHYDNAFVYYTLRALLQSVIVHISAPLSVCLYRNEKRRQMIESGEPESSKGSDLHYVPRNIMRDFYAKDQREDEQRSRNQKLVLSLLPARAYRCIENSEHDESGFREKAGQVVQNDLLPLILNSEVYEEYYQRRLAELDTTLESFARRPAT